MPGKDSIVKATRRKEDGLWYSTRRTARVQSPSTETTFITRTLCNTFSCQKVSSWVDPWASVEIIQDQDQRSPWQVGENVSKHLSLGLDSREGKILLQFYFLKKRKNILASGLFLSVCPILITMNHSIKHLLPAAKS